MAGIESGTNQEVLDKQQINQNLVEATNNNNIDTGKNNTGASLSELSREITSSNLAPSGCITPEGLSSKNPSNNANSMTGDISSIEKDLINSIASQNPVSNAVISEPETKVIYEKKLVEIKPNELNFKGNRLEKWENIIKNDPQYIYNNSNGNELLELIKSVWMNPTSDESNIIKFFFKDHKSLFDNNNLSENDLKGVPISERNDLRKKKELVQDIFKQNSDVTNSQKVEYIAKTIKNDKYDQKGFKNRLASMNTQKLAINGLLGDKGRGFERKITTFFRSFPLDKIFNIYKKSENSVDKGSVFESETDSLIKNEVVHRLNELKRKNKGLNINLNDPTVELLGRAMIEQKKRVAQIYFKQSIFFISSFIGDTQKGIEYFEKQKEKTVKDLVENPDFNEFSVNLSEELSGRRKMYTNLQKKQAFAEDVGMALLGLKIYDIDNATSMFSPGIKVGAGLYEKRIEYKKGDGAKINEGLYLGGQRYIINGINNISNIVISGNEVIVSGEKFGAQTHTKLTKTKFIDSIENLVLSGKSNFEAIDPKDDFTIQKAEV